MNAEISSMLTGTVVLSLVGVAALLLTLVRGGIASAAVRRVRLASTIALVMQLLHFTEEYSYRLYQQLPELLGLSPWPAAFFVAINCAWLLAWILGIVYIDRFPKAAVFTLWFLGIASVANGILHPLISIVIAQYFPGLWTSLLAGFAGANLSYRLFAATKQDEKTR